MRVAVSGATGFLGRPLVQRLLKAGHQVVPLGRNFPPSSLSGVEAILNLAGEPVARRWTSAQKVRIKESRVGTTAKLVAGAKEAGTVRRFVSASAVGYYGDAGAVPLDEESPPGRDFLAQVCSGWETEAALAQAAGIPTAVLRLGMVLHPEGGALRPILKQFRLGAGGRVGTGRQYVSWIHREDAVSLFLFALEHPQLVGPFNGVAPNPLAQADFARALGHSLHRPTLLHVPGLVLRVALGTMATMLLDGQRVYPKRTLAAGFRFEYPDLSEALSQLLAR